MLPRCQAAAGLVLSLCVLAQGVDASEYASPCTRLAQAAQLAEQIRGLPAKHPIRCAALSKSAYEKRDREYLARLISAEALERLGEIYRGLGFIPENFDFARCYVTETAQYASAFYDVFNKEVVLPSWEPSPMNVLVHEATHALQDQHFDLAPKTEAAAKTTDSSLAFSALIEGDARWVQEIFLETFPEAEDVSLKPPPQETAERNPCKFPENLESQIYFPYEFGPHFVERFMSGSRSFEQVNRLYLRIPRSTTEIIHRRAYGTFSPMSVSSSLSDVAEMAELDGFSVVQRDSLGQYTIRLLLGLAHPGPAAILGAKGWRGDSAALFHKGEQRLIVWKSLWENEREASEAYTRLVELKASQLGVGIGASSPSILVSINNNHYLFKRTGCSVILARRYKSASH
jgi:hypothetical protein